MKRIIVSNLFLSLLVITVVFASCSGNNKEAREKVMADSIALVQLIADSIRKAEAYFPNILVVQGNNVNLRISPKLDAVRIKQLKTGDTCEVLEKGRKQTIDEKTDYWYRINFKNKEGWLFGAFTSIRLSAKENETK